MQEPIEQENLVTLMTQEIALEAQLDQDIRIEYPLITQVENAFVLETTSLSICEEPKMEAIDLEDLNQEAKESEFSL